MVERQRKRNKIIISRPVNMSSNGVETRQERREQKLKKRRERMPKHGKNLARVYIDAVLKRLKRRRLDR
jgi:hypothetical protein